MIRTIHIIETLLSFPEDSPIILREAGINGKRLSIYDIVYSNETNEVVLLIGEDDGVSAIPRFIENKSANKNKKNIIRLIKEVEGEKVVV